MPASWRPSRGTAEPAFAIDEIVALAGVDRMTIGPPLLEQLAASCEPLERMLEPAAASAACADDLVGAHALASSRPPHAPCARPRVEPPPTRPSPQNSRPSRAPS